MRLQLVSGGKSAVNSFGLRWPRGMFAGSTAILFYSIHFPHAKSGINSVLQLD